ncbi:unnamed protein product [Diabrotica balteata]|uniref:Uncharacterized protein n=1 Tax=Diabrotica balteata TaxID=107213 RepID=A0A9N9XE84_DIABA|nr:unnamed protein product [Diabrotica balteata]
MIKYNSATLDTTPTVANEEVTDEGKGGKKMMNITPGDQKKKHREPHKKFGIDQMMKMMKELAMHVKDIKKEQYRSRDEITQLKREITELKDQHSDYKDEIRKLRETNEKAIKHIGQLEKKITAPNKKIEKLEREKKRKNVVIPGLNIDTNEQKLLRETVKNFLEKELEEKRRKYCLSGT